MAWGKLYAEVRGITLSQHSMAQHGTLQCCLASLIPPPVFLQLGANGYIFAIDLNGYVLLHPNLQPQVRRGLLGWQQQGLVGPMAS